MKELTSKWHGNETWEESEHKVKDLISNTLQIDADNIEIERAHRVGTKRPTSDKPRTIVAKFLNYKHRDMVLNERRKLAPRAPIPRPMFVMAPNGPFPAEFNRKCPTTTTRI